VHGDGGPSKGAGRFVSSKWSDPIPHRSASAGRTPSGTLPQGRVSKDLFMGGHPGSNSAIEFSAFEKGVVSGVFRSASETGRAFTYAFRGQSPTERSVALRDPPRPTGKARRGVDRHLPPQAKPGGGRDCPSWPHPWDFSARQESGWETAPFTCEVDGTGVIELMSSKAFNPLDLHPSRSLGPSPSFCAPPVCAIIRRPWGG
jgi:hypothetical protein